MKTFVVGDIHGAYLGLKQALERSNFDYQNDMLITLGDVCDGGPQTYEVIEELLKIKNRIDIMGNHDQWMHEFVTLGVHPDEWTQGGLATAQSYMDALGSELKVQRKHSEYTFGQKAGYILNIISEDVPISHQNFFKMQYRYYKDDNNNIFVHGGFDRHNPIQETLSYSMMWDRRLWSQARSAKSSKTGLNFAEEVNKVFIGHTTCASINNCKPVKSAQVWNLDTGAGYEGKVTIMNVDTEEYWQSDLIKDLYPNHEGR